MLIAILIDGTGSRGLPEVAWVHAIGGGTQLYGTASRLKAEICDNSFFSLKRWCTKPYGRIETRCQEDTLQIRCKAEEL